MARSPQKLNAVRRALATETRACNHASEAETASDRAMLAAHRDGWKDHEIASECGLSRSVIQKRRTRMAAKKDLARGRRLGES